MTLDERPQSGPIARNGFVQDDALFEKVGLGGVEQRNDPPVARRLAQLGDPVAHLRQDGGVLAMPQPPMALLVVVPRQRRSLRHASRPKANEEIALVCPASP